MKLELKNIGGFKEANIEINGITVIAGNNNTGKSTIGKTLFFVFNSLYNLDNTIREYRVQSIQNILDEGLKPIPFSLSSYATFEKFFYGKREITNNEEIVNILKNYCQGVFNHNLDNDEDDKNRFADKINSFDFQPIAKKIEEVFSVSREDYALSLLHNNFSIFFASTLANINTPNELGNIHLEVKDDILEFYISRKDFIQPEKIIDFYTNAIYIDNPFILDELMRERVHNIYVPQIPSDFFNTGSSHSLSRHLIEALTKPKNQNPTNEILVQKNLNAIFEKLKDLSIGEIYERGSGFKYSQEFGKEIPIANISTGLKVFLIIKTLLLNGSIQKNGTLILDEPEIHLHPEWQLVFAEIIVLLQKEFGLHILLTTHSPYFLKAIEKYSYAHEITDKCNYYLTECSDSSECNIKEVTGNTEEIYKKFYAPFKDLDTGR